MSAIPVRLEQGSQEWLDFRKTKITATDACVIMGASPWKTKAKLYLEKTSELPPEEPNERMRRGNELEPIAREMFSIENGIDVFPKVVVSEWAMASLDGMSEFGQYIVEIKCPGEKDHAIALSGKVPDHYYPQLQHQMYVTGLQFAYYYSFDGLDGVTLKVPRDDDYIEKMVEEEKKFYECIVNKIAPEPSEGDYIQREDDLWQQCASKWKEIVSQIKELESQEEDLRKQLIFLSGQSNTKGGGISLCRVQRKGNVEYSKIPELKNVDLESYRKASSESWRISSI